jgi:transcriptional regulator with XRE-family HTH domain
MASRVEIGKKVRIERRDLGYTQQKLSELIRINKTTISEIENGRFTGSFDIFERVLDAVGLQFDVSPKQHSCLIGMRLKICLLRMMNEYQTNLPAKITNITCVPIKLN